MADHNDPKDDLNQYDPIDHWTCSECLKPISASRPPVYNADNCCCSELGTYTNGGNTQSGQQYTATNSPKYESTVYGYQPASYTYDQSQTTSSGSAQYSEGSSRSTPNTITYLPLVPEPRLNESTHHLVSSNHTEMSYPMQLFLGQTGTPPTYTNGLSSPRFISQDPHVQSHHSSMKAKKGSKRSQPSLQSSGSGDGSFISRELDPLTGAGAWIDASGNRHCGGEYPMVMSGLVEPVVDDEL